MLVGPARWFTLKRLVNYVDEVLILYDEIMPRLECTKLRQSPCLMQGVICSIPRF